VTIVACEHLSTTLHGQEKGNLIDYNSEKRGQK